MAHSKTSPPILDAEDTRRFWSKVDRITTPQGCWLWTSTIFKDLGYGAFKAKRRMYRAHRVAFFLETGEWPPVVMHKCDVQLCCRYDPRHLRAGTDTENMADRDAKGRQASGDRNGSRTKPERLKRGEDHPESKLTDALVLLIRQRADTGESINAIADELGVSRSNAWRIARRKNWCHLP